METGKEKCMKKMLPIVWSCMCCCLIFCGAAAQQENNVWIFGSKAGLDFNSGPPASFVSDIGYGNREAAASVCDAQGNLLFYTDGSRVWNRNHMLMSNAQPLHPLSNSTGVTESTYQGTVIVPAIGSDSLYYVFSLTQSDFYSTNPSYASYGGRLFYSIIDMSLDNGLGDAVPGRKWLAMDFNLTEQMIAIPGEDCNVWLVVHDRDTNMFKAYEITRAGIATRPVRSYSGVHGAKLNAQQRNEWHLLGQMNVSPDRVRIGYSSTRANYSELHDFDPALGVVSNGQVLDSITPTIGGHSTHSGICFSPDNSKVYISGVRNEQLAGNRYFLCQFDLNASGGMAGVRATKTFLGETYISKQLRRGPDGKIYMPGFNSSDSISVVEMPDVAGTGCNHRVNAIGLSPGTLSDFNLGNPAVRALAPDTVIVTSDSLFFCAGENIELIAGFPSPVIWTDGLTDSVRIADSPGVYQVYHTVLEDCHWETRVFFVSEKDPRFSLGNDTVLCQGEVLRLDMSHVPGGHLWQGQYTGPVFETREAGMVMLEVDDNGCVHSDTIRVEVVSVAIDLGADTTLCYGKDTLALHLDVSPEATILWNDGESATDRYISQDGVYSVFVVYDRCSDSDAVRVRTEVCDCDTYFPGAFTPNGDGLNDHFRMIADETCPVAKYQLSIYNRWGQAVYRTSDYRSGWDGMFRGAAAESGTYMYLAEYATGTGMHTKKIKGDVMLVR